MALKRCSACKEPKELEAFNKSASRRDGRQNVCRSCSSRNSKSYYRANKTRMRAQIAERDAQRLKDRRDKIRAYLSEHPCVDCGEADSIVLEFDHVRGVKVADVSVMLTQQMPWARIVDEIAKCDVRCANCHRRKTAKEREMKKLKRRAARDLLGS